MNIKITARYGEKWEGVVSHDAYGELLEFTATGATRPEPIRCPVSVFRSACELARPLATAAARKAISELEVAALNGYTRLGKVYPLPGSAEPEPGFIFRGDAIGARCSQCGQRWAASACGPTHAIIKSEITPVVADGDCRTIEEAAAPGPGRMPMAFRDGQYPAEGAAEPVRELRGACGRKSFIAKGDNREN